MQRFMKFAVIALVFFSCMVGTGFGSENDKRGRDSGHSGSHEDKLYGIVQKMPAKIPGIWIVDGKEIQVTNHTIIKEKYGKAAVGVYVEVEGSYADNTFIASKIEVKRGLK